MAVCWSLGEIDDWNSTDRSTDCQEELITEATTVVADPVQYCLTEGGGGALFI